MNARAQHEEDVPGEDSFVLENQEDLDDETQLLVDPDHPTKEVDRIDGEAEDLTLT